MDSTRTYPDRGTWKVTYGNLYQKTQESLMDTTRIWWKGTLTPAWQSSRKKCCDPPTFTQKDGGHFTWTAEFSSQDFLQSFWRSIGQAWNLISQISVWRRMTSLPGRPQPYVLCFLGWEADPPPTQHWRRWMAGSMRPDHQRCHTDTPHQRQKCFRNFITQELQNLHQSF